MTSPTATVYANSQTWLGCARETTRGVPVAAPAFWIPVVKPSLKPQINELHDEGYRGEMNYTWQQVQGARGRHDVYEFKFLANLDVLPHVLRSVLGSPDTVASSGSLFSHTLSLLNNAAPDQPPSYTWFDYDGFRVRQMAGGQTDRVTLTWKSTGLLEVSVRILAYPAQIITVAAAPAISSYPPTTGWDTLLTFNSGSRSNLVDGMVTFMRRVVPIPTLGAQTPYSLFADRLDVRGSIRVLNADDSEFSAWLQDSVVPLSLKFTNADSKSLTLNSTTMKFELGEQQRDSDGLITTTLSLLPLPNTSDATAGGSSPIKATIVNGQSAAY